MVGTLQPLVNSQAIVNQDGTPTDYFIRWAQQRQIDIGDGITAEQALAIVVQFAADHVLAAGLGISLTPSGNIHDNITITAKVQEILDQISNVRGSILYRGAAGWAALAPGTAGNFLKTNGAGADPAWAAAGGGGGALTKIGQVVVAGAAAANIVFASIPATSEDLIISLQGQLTGGAVDFIWASLNGDTALHYQWTRGAFQASGVSYASGTSAGLNAGLIGPGIAGNFADSLEATIFSYARTTFNKSCLARSSLRFGANANQTSTEVHSSEWLSTAAVNAITLTPNSGTFAIGTVATLYGRG